jgi:1,4-dihydroxy-2-naphthoate octaprenyltransferase
MAPWLLATRPKTLVAAVVPVVVGTALARGLSGTFHPLLFGCALAGAVLIQIGTNLVNDAADFQRGVDSAGRVGPVRVTQAGLLAASSVMTAAWLCFAAAVLASIPLVLARGMPIVAIGLASILAGYAYTAGPYPLAYHGMGELFVIVFFGIVAVAGSYFVQTPAVSVEAVLAGIAIGCLATVILTINNLRDLAQDRGAGKRTVAVQLGERGARLEVALFALLPFLIAIALVMTTGRWLVLLVFLALPLAILIIRRLTWQGAALNRLLALAALLEATFGMLLAVAFLWG